MKLYLFEHCSLCFRVRMTAALKRLHLQETVVLDDDSDAMIGIVGKRVIPILVKDDGQPILESMDMVSYIDGRLKAGNASFANSTSTGAIPGADAISLISNAGITDRVSVIGDMLNDFFRTRLLPDVRLKVAAV
jgi:Glutathione S-transferase, N-terminal domain